MPGTLLLSNTQQRESSKMGAKIDKKIRVFSIASVRPTDSAIQQNSAAQVKSTQTVNDSSPIEG